MDKNTLIPKRILIREETWQKLEAEAKKPENQRTPNAQASIVLDDYFKQKGSSDEEK